MNKYFDQINAFIDAHHDEMLEKWAALVNLEGHYSEKEKVEAARAWVKAEFEAEGFVCSVHEVAENRCGILDGVLGAGRHGKPILFGGHIDTVHMSGSFDGPNPFKIVDGKAYGPGVLDMKGGIVIALYVVKALNSIGYDERPIRIIFAGEEESDHIGNNADLYYQEHAKGAVCAFNMETGHIENCLCLGRKTQYTIRGKVHGLGGHAGNEFTKGKNALHEAMLKLTEIMKLTELDKGTTVTVSMLRAGCPENQTSIPDLAEFIIDLRIFSADLGKELLAKVEKLLNTTYIEGTTTEYTVDFAKLYAFFANDRTYNFFNHLNSVAEENGFEQFGEIKLGGASDAGSISMAGVPVICSAGVIGEYNHNRREYAVVQSLFDRAKIYATAITEMDKDF
ncbi:MAG: M20/M25/M40 family metallo-hydrolase [Candidatus Heteroscillospira sp.]|jgi:glutamate carboxypeptidase